MAAGEQPTITVPFTRNISSLTLWPLCARATGLGKESFSLHCTSVRASPEVAFAVMRQLRHNLAAAQEGCLWCLKTAVLQMCRM
jgi:hypothetical protein